ncbi:MAG: T9SS type A sorting domain-containing protein [Bacteroidia bacterium]
MKTKFYSSIIIAALTLLVAHGANAQCTWQTTITDGFEYQTVCPDLIPGTTIHNIPQSYAVHNGTYSLYLNFVNCVGGTGCCAGDTVYKRSIAVCRNMSQRFSTWFTTSFTGLQCDLKIVITDGNNNVLNLQPSISAPYSPLWIQYNSGTVTPTTDTINFIMITNVGGGNGNDLSMDDFLMETCYPNSTATSTNGNICSNDSVYNLVDFLSANADTTGTWGGPSALGGGYLGTYTTATSPAGAYIYTSAFYGTGPGCPMTTDTVLVDTVSPPAPYLGNDTIICSTSTLLLDPGNFPGGGYVWNTGAITHTLLASTIFVNGDTSIYTIKITDTNGCIGTDTVTVIFFDCSGIDEYDQSSILSVTPNPARDFILIRSDNKLIEKINILNINGKVVKSLSSFEPGKIFIGDLLKGIYTIEVINGNRIVAGKFIKM